MKSSISKLRAFESLRHWSEDNELYNGGCCQRDQDEQEAREAEAAKGER